MLTCVQLNGKRVRFSSLKAFRRSQPPEKYQEFEVYCLMDFKKGKRKKLTGKAELRTVTVHRISFQLCLYTAEELWTWQTEVWMFSKWLKAAGLKTPYCREKKNHQKPTKMNLCRNNSNNNNNKNLHFVILRSTTHWGQQEREWEEAACQLHCAAEPCPRFDS